MNYGEDDDGTPEAVKRIDNMFDRDETKAKYYRALAIEALALLESMKRTSCELDVVAAPVGVGSARST
jgi:hypothetical protein